MPSIKVKFFGLNDLTSRIGDNQLNLDLDGNTFRDALKQLDNTFGAAFHNAVLNKQGEVDTTIQVVKNGDEWLSRDGYNQRLEEGDELCFFLMIAGG